MKSQERVDKTISSISIIWFLFYPTLVGYLASSINCTKLEDDFRLYDDLEQICYTGRHLEIMTQIALPGILLWAFGVPLLGLWLLKRSLKQL